MHHGHAQANRLCPTPIDGDTNFHFQPLPMLTLHQRRCEHMADYPESARLLEESLSLSIHLELTDDDVTRIIRTVKEEVETI